MVRTFVLADLLTLGNAACGTTAIFMCLQHVEHPDSAYLVATFALLPIAFILDALDGWVARTTGRSSPLGGDLDSLADTISFGVAPACLANPELILLDEPTSGLDPHLVIRMRELFRSARGRTTLVIQK